jgi:hypothetical protein
VDELIQMCYWLLVEPYPAEKWWSCLKPPTRLIKSNSPSPSRCPELMQEICRRGQRKWPQSQWSGSQSQGCGTSDKTPKWRPPAMRLEMLKSLESYGVLPKDRRFLADLGLYDGSWWFMGISSKLFSDKSSIQMSQMSDKSTKRLPSLQNQRENTLKYHSSINNLWPSPWNIPWWFHTFGTI